MYRYQRFGTVMLPTGNINQKVGSMATADSTVTVGGGSTFDALGSDDAPSKPGSVTLTASLRESNRTALETSFRELQALRGKVLKLYRAWEPSGRVEWIYARLMQVDASANFWSNRRMGAVQMKWALLDNVWNGDDHAVWTIGDGSILDTGLDFDNVDTTNQLFFFAGFPSTGTFSIFNNGNAATTAVKISFYEIGLANSSPAEKTQVTLEKTSGEVSHIVLHEDVIEPNPPTSPSKTIVIDNRQSTIELEWFDIPTVSYLSENVYDKFSLGTDHASESWVMLEPGENTFEVTPLTIPSDFSITITVEFSDGWQ